MFTFIMDASQLSPTAAVQFFLGYVLSYVRADVFEASMNLSSTVATEDPIRNT